MRELLHTRLHVPGPPAPVGEVGAGGQRGRVLGARYPLAHWQQRGELVAGTSRIPRPPGPGGEVAAGGQRVRVLGSQDPLQDRQQRCELVAGVTIACTSAAAAMAARATTISATLPASSPRTAQIYRLNRQTSCS